MKHRAVRHAILASGVLDFLQDVAAVEVPELQKPDYRLVYRSKGDAITCIGNFFESMDGEEWASVKVEELLKVIEKTARDEDLPLTLRAQAAFAIERYNAASEERGSWPRSVEDQPLA